ncbi:hypothetical protein CY35_04G146200 [Sphagnum magellanicum]|nr:hypothetical protein CY35_04G146200 [Sphagnum magellanicum]
MPIMFLQADTRMLEDGYYKSSLALHPIQSAASINDNELMQYLCSKTGGLAYYYFTCNFFSVQTDIVCKCVWVQYRTKFLRKTFFLQLEGCLGFHMGSSTPVVYYLSQYVCDSAPVVCGR